MINLLGKIAGSCPGLVLRLRCLKRLKKWPDFDKPDNIFEQMMALALINGNNPLWAKVSDKIAIHDYVSEILGPEYTNAIYGTWESPEDIDFDTLPDRFVLKTNNSCGTNIIVTDKSTLDVDAAKSKLAKWLKFPYGNLTGQKHYSLIRPMILAEEFLDNTSPELSSSAIDYKFLCFYGEPVLMYIYYDRTVNSHRPVSQIFDLQGRQLRKYMLESDLKKDVMPMPVSFEKMKNAARKLAQPFELVRIDFYEVNSQPILGEISLTPGLEMCTPEFHTDMQKLFLEKRASSRWHAINPELLPQTGRETIANQNFN